MSGPPKMTNRVHANAIWTEALHKESKINAIWDDNWGFLRHDRLEKLTKEGFDSLKPAVAMNGVVAAPAKTTQTTQKPTGPMVFDSEKHMQARTRYIMNSTKTPKEKLVAPSTTFQEIGWRPSLELFGVAHHGLKRDKELQGVGTKFLRTDTINADKLGIKVKDCHAEILAMRGFRMFLIDQLKKAENGVPSVFKKNDDDGPKFSLLSSVTFHMYSSSQPCGNASIKRWAKGGIGPTFPSLSASSFPNLPPHPPLNPPALAQGQVAVLLKRPPADDPFYSTIGFDEASGKPKANLGKDVQWADIPLSCLPLPPAPEAANAPNSRQRQAVPIPKGTCLTCSDKIMQRNVLGYQGKYLSCKSLFGGRIEVKSITVGRKYSQKASERAFCCRVEAVLPEDPPCAAEEEAAPAEGGVKKTRVCEESDATLQEAAVAEKKPARAPKKPKGYVGVPAPYGVRHMLLMSTSVKLDNAVYAAGGGDAQAEDEAMTGASFREQRCVAWAKVSGEVLGVSFGFADGQAVVIDGVTGLTGAGGVLKSVESEEGTDNERGTEECFLSSRALRESAQKFLGAVTVAENDNADYVKAKEALRTKSLPFVFA